MKHKWHKEIKAWADGAEIEQSILVETNHGEFDWCEWQVTTEPTWETVEYMYRIKPQPKEPQYLYIYGKGMGIELTLGQLENRTLIGKIKLESDNV